MPVGTLDGAAHLLSSIASLVWPLILLLVIWKLLPQIRNALATRSVSVEVLGTKISIQDASDQFHQAIEDLQTQLSELKAAVADTGLAPSEAEVSDGTATTEELVEPAPAVEPRSSGALRQLLWVDDRPTNNIYLMKTLRDMGYSISEATTTADALRALENRGPFDLVITDMGRSEDGTYKQDAGLQFIREARARGVRAPIFVFASVDAVSRYALEVSEAGGQGITASPTELLALLQTRSEASFEAQIETLLRSLGYVPARSQRRGAPDFLIEVGQQHVGIEVKGWSRRPSAAVLQRVLDRLLAAQKALELDRIVLVTPAPLAAQTTLIGGEHLQFATPAELRQALEGQ